MNKSPIKTVKIITYHISLYDNFHWKPTPDGFLLTVYDFEGAERINHEIHFGTDKLPAFRAMLKHLETLAVPKGRKPRQKHGQSLPAASD